MFGLGKKKEAKNVLLLDIESGTVGSALTNLSEGSPKLYAYNRQRAGIHNVRDSESIVRSLEKMLDDSLRSTGTIAGRLRVHGNKGLGDIGSAAVFLSAPWGMPNLATGKPEYLPGMRAYISEQIPSVLGDMPVTFYTSADALGFGSNIIDTHDTTLFASLRGEFIEMLLLSQDAPKGFSTVPAGSHSVLRTLRTHGSLTENEARSLMQLVPHKGNRFYEPLTAAGRHLSEQFAEGAKLLTEGGAANRIIVVGEHPMAEWFAKHIAEEPKIVPLFAEDATVEALRPHHLNGHVEHGGVQDPYLMLEALFVGNKKA